MKFENDELEINDRERYRIEVLVDNVIDRFNRVAEILDIAKWHLPADQRDPFRTRWDEVARQRWPRLSAGCLPQFKKAIAQGDNAADKILDCLPAAAEDPEYLGWCLYEFRRHAATKSSTRTKLFEILKRFRCWSGSTARRFFEYIGQDKELPMYGSASNLLAPTCALRQQDRVCIALTLLMYERNRIAAMREGVSIYDREKLEENSRYIAGLEDGRTILSLFALLDDLPAGHYSHRPLWSEFGPDEKAVWRGEVARVVADDLVVRHGLFEHLVWQTRSESSSSALYSDIEVLLLALCTTEEDVDFVAALADHPSRLVHVRAAALLSRLGRSSTPLMSLPQDGITAAAGAQALAAAGGSEIAGRTWMQNKAVERVIYGAVQRVEQDFALRYPREWRLDEEVHLATLLSELQGSFKSTNGVLDVLASGGVATPRIDFSFRQISKHEEGAKGVGTRRFSVDVVFIIHVTDAGQTVSKRAAFIQCKKLRSRSEDVWEPSFDIDRVQCDELIAQTEASFYMFLTPPFAGSEIWMTPARLVRNLTWLHGSGERKRASGRSALLRVPTYFASRSLAQWLTYDIFGLWTGDERKEALAKAEPHGAGLSPRFVVTVRIRSNPTPDEASR